MLKIARSSPLDLSAAILLFAAGLAAQNPNGPLASLSVNGAFGPPFPIQATIPSPGVLNLTVGGLPGMPYMIAHNPLMPGSLVIPGTAGPGIVDIALVPPPTILFNGFAGGIGGLLYTIGAGGTSTISISIPAGLDVPVGAVQGMVASPTPAGISLTAATDIDLSTNMSGTINLVQNGSALIPLSCPFTFYGTTYSSVFVNANGNLTFGSPDGTAFETSAGMLAGPPRIAPFWHALDPTIAVGPTAPSVTYSSNAIGTTITWTNVVEFIPPCVGCPINVITTRHRHTFSVRLGCDGTIFFDYTIGNQKSNRALAGISPGGGISAAAAVNFSLLPPTFAGGSSAALFELFEGTQPALSGGLGADISRRFDLRQRTVTFTPTGGGSSYAVALNAAPLHLELIGDTPATTPVLISLSAAVFIRGTGFSPAATISYRISGTTGFWTPIATFVTNGENIVVTGLPTFSSETYIDMQISQAGSAPVVWLRAMESPGGSSGWGHLYFGIAGQSPESCSLATAGPLSLNVFGSAYGQPPYSPYYANANGNISFGSASSAIGTGTGELSGLRRLCGVFADLVPSTGNNVLASWLVVTPTPAPNARHKVFYRCVPEYPDAGSNTFSFTTRANGTLEVDYRQITAEEFYAGLSSGGSVGASSDLTSAIGTTISSSIYQAFGFSSPPDLAGLRIRYVPTSSAATSYMLSP